MKKIITCRNIFLGCALLGILSACDSEKSREPVEPVATLEVNPTEVVFAQEGEQSSIHIVTNRGWVVTKEDAPWFVFEGATVGESGESDVKMKSMPYMGADPRTAKITVTAGGEQKILAVTQFGKLPAIILPRKKIELGYAGYTASFVANSNVAITSEVPSDSWLRVVKANTPSSVSLTSTMYQLTVDENSGAARTGRVIFASDKGASDTLTVSQAMFFEEIQARPEMTVGGLRREVPVVVTSSGNWNFTFAGGTTALPEGVTSVTPMSGGKGVTTVVFTLEDNETTAVRSFAGEFACGNAKTPFALTQRFSTLREKDSLAVATIFKAGSYYGSDKWDYETPINTWIQRGLSLTNNRVDVLNLSDWRFDNGLPAAIGDLDQLTEFIFSNSGLVGNLPEEFGNLVNLEKVALVVVQGLSELPASFRNLTKLKELMLYGASNMSDEVVDFEFPEVITSLPDLWRVDIRGISMPEIPASIANMSAKLKYLSCVSTHLTAIQPELSKLSNLTDLELSNNKVLGGEIPAAIFTGCLQLKSFGAFNCNLSGEIPFAAFTHPKLFSLSIYNNNLTGELPVELSTVSKISSLSISMNKLGDGTGALPQEIVMDKRFSGSWNAAFSVCKQQAGHGWTNCEPIQ